METQFIRTTLFTTDSLREARMIGFAEVPKNIDQHIELEEEIDQNLNEKEITEEIINDVNDKIDRLGMSNANDWSDASGTHGDLRLKKFEELYKKFEIKKKEVEDLKKAKELTKDPDFEKTKDQINKFDSDPTIDVGALVAKMKEKTTNALEKIRKITIEKPSNYTEQLRANNKVIRELRPGVDIKLSSFAHLENPEELPATIKRLFDTAFDNPEAKRVSDLSKAIEVLNTTKSDENIKEVKRLGANTKDIIQGEIKTILAAPKIPGNIDEILDAYAKRLDDIDKRVNDAIGVTPASAPPAAPAGAPPADPDKKFDENWDDNDEKLIASINETEMKNNVELIDKITATDKMREAVTELNKRLVEAKSPFRLKEDGKNILMDTELGLSGSDLVAIDQLKTPESEEGALTVLAKGKTGRDLSTRADIINTVLEKKGVKIRVEIKSEKLTLTKDAPASEPDTAEVKESVKTGVEKILKFLKEIFEIMKAELLLESNDLSVMRKRIEAIDVEIVGLENGKDQKNDSEKKQIDNKISDLKTEKIRLENRIKVVEKSNGRLLRDFKDKEIGDGTSIDLKNDRNGDLYLGAKDGADPARLSEMRNFSKECHKKYPNCSIPRYPHYTSHMYPTPRVYNIDNSRNINNSPGAQIIG